MIVVELENKKGETITEEVEVGESIFVGNQTKFVRVIDVVSPNKGKSITEELL